MADDLAEYERNIRDGLPAIVVEGFMPEGATVFHKHPEADDVWRLAALLRMGRDVRGGKTLRVKEIGGILRAEFPGLEFDDAGLNRFLSRYVDPLVFLPDEFWKRGIVEADARKNTIQAVMELAETMQEEVEKARSIVGAVEQDDEGRIRRVGPTHKEFLAMAKMALEARVAQREEMSLMGMAPASKKGPGVQVNVGIGIQPDPSAAFGGAGFRRQDVVDGEFSRQGEAEG